MLSKVVIISLAIILMSTGSDAGTNCTICVGAFTALGVVITGAVACIKASLVAFILAILKLAAGLCLPISLAVDCAALCLGIYAYIQAYILAIIPPVCVAGLKTKLSAAALACIKVEAELKNDRYVDNICVYGDSFHIHLVGLVVPNVRALKSLAEQLGITSDKLNDWVNDEKIVAEVTKELMKFGTEAGLNRMEIPTKIKLCSEDWNPDNGFVTAALKLKRKNIQNFYQKDIDRLYGKLQNNNNIK